MITEILLSTQLQVGQLSSNLKIEKPYISIYNEYFYQEITYSPANLTTATDGISINVNMDILTFHNELMAIKGLLKERLNVEISEYWVPEGIENDNLTLLIKCSIPKDILEDFDKLWDFEVSLYTSLKDYFSKSKKIKMVALLQYLGQKDQGK